MSGGAMSRAAATVATGNVSDGVNKYLLVARNNFNDQRREESLWMAARLTLLELQRPDTSILLWREYIEKWPDSPRLGEAYANLATVYASYLEDHVRAAEYWERGAVISPNHKSAGVWLLHAGDSYLDAKQMDRAFRSLTAATFFADQQEAALLGLGRLSLASDPSAAYEYYRKTVELRGPEAGLARLGLATALERLEKWDAALAEVDEAIDDLGEDPALYRRRHRLQATHGK